MWAAWPSNTIVSYITTRCYNTEDHDLNSVSILRVVIDRTLTWGTHVDKMCSRLTLCMYSKQFYM